jgi:hypothetical protein
VDQDDFEEALVFERASGEPDSTGCLSEPAEFQGGPPELVSQIKIVLKALGKVDRTTSATNKRKRDEVIDSVVSAALDDRLAQYGTTVGEDTLLLQSSEVSRRRRMAVGVRLGEKKLLWEAKEFAVKKTEADDEIRAAKKTK